VLELIGCSLCCDANNLLYFVSGSKTPRWLISGRFWCQINWKSGKSMFLCYPEIIEFPCQKEKLLSSLVKKRNY
jgi:hypothetical protein